MLWKNGVEESDESESHTSPVSRVSLENHFILICKARTVALPHNAVKRVPLMWAKMLYSEKKLHI
jgi:hypothetical protein